MLALAAALLASPTTADDCPFVGYTAATIMEARQVGVPLQTSMLIVGNSSFWRWVVLQAYAEPRHTDPTIQDEIILDFATHYELACYAALG
jgi:hypothetical protein